MTIERATTPAELRAALLADETLGPVAAKAIIDAAQVPEIAAAITLAEAARAAASGGVGAGPGHPQRRCRRTPAHRPRLIGGGV